MADVVYELLATIGIDSSGVSQGLNEAKQEIDNSDISESLEKKFTLASAAIVAGGIAIGKAVGATVKTLTGFAVDTAAYADNLLTMSTVTGLTTEQLQEFNYMSELVDVSTDTITGSMTKLVKTMSSARDGGEKQAAAFERLGVEVTDSEGNLRDSYDVFLDVIDALGEMEDGTERDALSMEIFGRNAKVLNPLIAQGSKGIEKFAEEARELGFVISSDDLSNLGALDDAMQRFANFKKTVKNRLGLAMAPAVERILDKFLELGNKIDWEKVGDRLGSALELGADKLIGFIENVDFDKLLSGATTLFEGVISGISFVLEHADEILKFIRDVGAGLLIGKGANLLSNLFGGAAGAKTAATAASTAAKVGTTAATGAATGGAGVSASAILGTGAAAMLPATLLAAFGFGIKDYVGARKEAIEGATMSSEASLAELEANVAEQKRLLEEAQAFYDQRDEMEMWASLSGLEPADGQWLSSQALAQRDAAKAAYELALQQYNDALAAAENNSQDTEAAVSDTLSGLSAQAGEWGVDMMVAMANGIESGAYSAVIPAVSGVASAIWGLLHHSEPETGPLSDDSTWMPDMMHGFAEGIRKGAPEVQGAVKDAFDVKTYAGFGLGGAGGRVFGGMNVTINVNGNRYGDEETLAERISYEIRRLFDREDAAYA